MKLLFDQNISPRILKIPPPKFSKSEQIRFVGLENSSDIRIFEFARNNQFPLVTFDSDFVDLNTMRGTAGKLFTVKRVFDNIPK